MPPQMGLPRLPPPPPLPPQLGLPQHRHPPHPLRRLRRHRHRNAQRKKPRMTTRYMYMYMYVYVDAYAYIYLYERSAKKPRMTKRFDIHPPPLLPSPLLSSFLISSHLVSSHLISSSFLSSEADGGRISSLEDDEDAIDNLGNNRHDLDNNWHNPDSFGSGDPDINQQTTGESYMSTVELGMRELRRDLAVSE